MIVKLYCGAALRKAEKERCIIEGLSSSGICTPRVLGCGAINMNDFSALVTEDLGDRTLWRSVDEGEYSHQEAFELVGQLLAAFHAVDPAVIVGVFNPRHRYDTKIEWCIQRHLSILRRDSTDQVAGRAEPGLRRLVELSRTSRTEVLCHGDLHPSNVIMCRLARGDPTPHVVDFEAAALCPPEYDLAKSIVTSSALDDSARIAILSGYANRPAISEELLYAFVVFHVVDGWVHAALLERRDVSLWRSRVDGMFARYAPLF